MGKFYRELMSAFKTYDKNEGKHVHLDAIKLRIILKKIHSDSL